MAATTFVKLMIFAVTLPENLISFLLHSHVDKIEINVASKHLAKRGTQVNRCGRRLTVPYACTLYRRR